jgi:hypothetical protein
VNFPNKKCQSLNTNTHINNIFVGSGAIWITSGTTLQTTILFENGIKDNVFLWGKGKSFGSSREEYTFPSLTGIDFGQELMFGIGMTGEGGSGSVVGQDWSKKTFGSISFGKLSSILGSSKTGAGLIKKDKSWQNLSSDRWSEIVSNVKEGLEAGKKLGEGVNQAKKEFQEIATDSCVNCGTIGSNDQLNKQKCYYTVPRSNKKK